jgi:hypothetical protein
MKESISRNMKKKTKIHATDASSMMKLGEISGRVMTGEE